MLFVDLPPTYGPARDAAILARMRSGAFDAIKWGSVASSSGAHTATFRVFSDALTMDGVRINVSAFLAQQIADLLSCSLLTARLADLLFLARSVTIAPTPQPITSTTQGMEEHSGRIDDLITQAVGNVKPPDASIVQSVGKHWILDNDTARGKFGQRTACNYGWHFVGTSFGGASARAVTPGLYLIQDRGWVHPNDHSDYSQTCVLVSQTCIVDGETRKLSDVLSSPELAPLASHQGPLLLLRQPLVPVASPVASLSTASVWLPLVKLSCPANLPAIPGSFAPILKPYSALLTQWSNRWDLYPLGTLIADTVEGLPVLARLECLWVAGADPSSARGTWAKGVGLYAPTANGQALTTPPAGWPGVAPA